MAEYFKAKGKKEVKYIMIQGTLGNVSTTKRSAGVICTLEDNGIKATEAQAPLVADWDRPTAQEMVQPLVAAIEYDCIISNNDAMALGAIEACKDTGVENALFTAVSPGPCKAADADNQSQHFRYCTGVWIWKRRAFRSSV